MQNAERAGGAPLVARTARPLVRGRLARGGRMQKAECRMQKELAAAPSWRGRPVRWFAGGSPARKIVSLMKLIVVAFLLAGIALPSTAAPRRRAVQTPPPQVILSFDFAGGSALGWEAGFADYHEGMDMRTEAGIRLLPPEVGPGSGYYLSGWNYSDDLFMFLRRRLGPSDGIAAGRSYVVRFEVTLATSAGRDCAGIGGAPGESVYVKLGAAPLRPEPVLVGDELRMSVDKGNQAEGGVHASVAGTISADEPLPCSNAPFVDLVRTHTHRYAIPASSEGDLWLLFGTDSGYEGFTSIYVRRIEVTLTPVAEGDPRTRWQKTYADVFELVGELEAAGVVLAEVSRNSHGLLGAREIAFAAGTPGSGEELYVYVFDTAEDAARGRSLISPDGERIGGVEIGWIAPPHFFEGDHFIANYTGADALALSLLASRLGPQFAGR
jgi:hypothetical protein